MKFGSGKNWPIQLVGVIAGIVLAYAWMFLFAFLEFRFLSTTRYVNGMAVTGYSSGPADYWVAGGAMPIFIVLGHFLVYAYRTGGEEKANDIKIFKGLILGFAICLLAAIYLQFGYPGLYPESSSIFISAGYVVMAAICFILRMDWNRMMTGIITAFLLVLFLSDVLGYFHLSGY